MKQSVAPWAAFLASCFLVVGLMGLFASYAGQIPLQRALSRLDVLDQVIAATHGPNAADQLDRLRPLLADRASILDAPGQIEDRVAAERRAAITEGQAESNAVSARVRLLLLFVTGMAGLFGIGILVIARRS